ncbi:hypothetical protein KCU85_g53, partial [Aureobasidium melanogenum]
MKEASDRVRCLEEGRFSDVSQTNLQLRLFPGRPKGIFSSLTTFLGGILPRPLAVRRPVDAQRVRRKWSQITIWMDNEVGRYAVQRGSSGTRLGGPSTIYADIVICIHVHISSATYGNCNDLAGINETSVVDIAIKVLNTSLVAYP